MFAEVYDLTLYDRGYTVLTGQKWLVEKINRTPKISNVIHRSDMFADFYDLTLYKRGYIVLTE